MRDSVTDKILSHFSATPARLFWSSQAPPLNMAPLFESLRNDRMDISHRPHIKKHHYGVFLYVGDEGFEPPTFAV